MFHEWQSAGVDGSSGVLTLQPIFSPPLLVVVLSNCLVVPIRPQRTIIKFVWTFQTQLYGLDSVETLFPLIHFGSVV